MNHFCNQISPLLLMGMPEFTLLTSLFQLAAQNTLQHTFCHSKIKCGRVIIFQRDYLHRQRLVENKLHKAGAPNTVHL